MIPAPNVTRVWPETNAAAPSARSVTATPAAPGAACEGCGGVSARIWMAGTFVMSDVIVLTMLTLAPPTGRPLGTRSDSRRMPRAASTTVLLDAVTVTGVPATGVNVTW